LTGFSIAPQIVHTISRFSVGLRRKEASLRYTIMSAWFIDDAHAVRTASITSWITRSPNHCTGFVVNTNTSKVVPKLHITPRR